MCARGAQSPWIRHARCVRSATEVFWWNCHSSKAFFSPWTGCDNKKNVVRDRKEKERVRRALLSCAAWPVSFGILVVDMVCLSREGVPSFPSCRLVVFGSFENFQCVDLTLARVWKVLLNWPDVPS